MTTPFPPWARWIAQAKYGPIFVFDKKPEPGCAMWLPCLGGRSKCIHGFPEYHSTYIAPHWRNSLDCLGEDDETV